MRSHLFPPREAVTRSKRPLWNLIDLEQAGLLVLLALIVLGHALITLIDDDPAVRSFLTIPFNP